MRRFTAFAVGCVLGVGGVLLCAGVGFYVSAPEYYRILFVGSDQRGTERSRSDIMVVVQIPKSPDKKMVMFSIPRDTKVDDAEYGIQKMTHFYAFGDRPDDSKLLGNIALTQKHIEALLDTQIDATVESSFTSFEDIVNALGGGCLEGACNTDGSEALAMIRDRFSEGRSDFSRQNDSQQLIASLGQKLTSVTNIQKVMEIMHTSTTARVAYDRAELVHFGFGYMVAHKGKMTLGEIDSLTVPGSSDMIYTPSFGKKLYYWIPNTEELRVLIDQHLR